MDSEAPDVHVPSARAPSWWANIFLSALTASLVTCAVFWLGPGGDSQAPAAAVAVAEAPAQVQPQGPAQVPRVVGVDVDVAGDLLAARGLTVHVTEERPDLYSWAGAILEQKPLPGTHVAAGERVEVVVAAGAAKSEIKVPHVAGQTLAQAREALEAKGLRVGPVVPTDIDDEAVVVSTTPAGGEAVIRGSMIGFAVELSGPVVPPVVGRSWTTAVKQFKAVGLKLGDIKERFDERYRTWVVLETDPPPGTRVLRGSTVNIVRNEGD